MSQTTSLDIPKLKPLSRLLRTVLHSTGLYGPMRTAVWKARGRGLLPWSPLVPEDAFTQCIARAIEPLVRRGHDFGDYLEFGVSRGTSLACVHHVLANAGLTHVRLIGFDSFEGLPEEAAEQGWEPQQFRSTLSATQAYLRSRNVEMDRVHLVPGWFRDTCTNETVEHLQLAKASVVMIDCDIYSASKEALDFCAPLIRDEAIFIFDDWGWVEARGIHGQKEAFAEFLEANPRLSATPITPAYIPHARLFHVTAEASEAPAS
jgi:O-methyltransferase